MTNIEQALSAARGELRHQGLEPSECTVADAEQVLDDMAREGKTAGIWFWNATDTEIKRFRKEWKK